MQDAILSLVLLGALLCPVYAGFADEQAGTVRGDPAPAKVEPNGVSNAHEPSVVGQGAAGSAAGKVRNDIIKSIEFEGNVKFKDKVLRQRLGFEVGDHLDPYLAEGGRLTLADVYRKIGYASVKVTLDKEKLAQGQVFYKIEEGPRVEIGQIKFEGNKAIGAGTLKSVVKTKKNKWLIWPCYYTEDAVEQDLDRLRKFYYEKGFLDYTIIVRKEFSENRKTVNLVFVVEEGPLYHIGRIIFTGNQHFTEQQLRMKLELTEGQVYLKPKAEKSARQIADVYREHGYVDADVAEMPRFTRQTAGGFTSKGGYNLIDVEFIVSEGQRFRIGRIDIAGNDTTDDKVVRRVLDEYGFTPGNWYDASMAPKEGAGKLEKYAQRMSLADEVMIRPVSPADGAADHKDVRIDVKEGATGLIMPGVAISSDNGISGRLIYEQRNFDITDWPEDFREFITMKAFRGCGQSLRIMLEPGTEFSQYSVSFTDPYFRDKPVTFELLGASWMRFRESYDEDRLKGYVALEKRRKDQWRTSVGFRAESVKVHNLDYDTPQEIRNVAGHNDVLGVRFGVGKSTVDDRFDPTKGDVFNIGCEPVLGDFTFGVLSGNYVRYYTLWEDALNRKTVLAGKVEAAKILGHAPPFEKFYAGGVSGYDIRGFRYRGVSTRGLQTNVPNPQYMDPIGSNWVFLASAEVTVPIIEENFAGLFFVDSGTIDTGRYRISIGTGIQIKLPQLLGAVPMRFELATPLCKDELDETQVFSFTMGGLFR